MKNIFKTDKKHQFLLGIVLIIYILADIQTPLELAKLIDNVYGNIVVVLIALSIFVNGKSPNIIGILAFIVAYILIKRSSVSSGTHGIRNYVSSEKNKVLDFSKFNDFPVSLEEEVIAAMAPLVKHDAAPNVNYKPVLDGLHDAAPLDYDGVI